jgi:hypothetical protein
MKRAGWNLVCVGFFLFLLKFIAYSATANHCLKEVLLTSVDPCWRCSQSRESVLTDIYGSDQRNGVT